MFDKRRRPFDLFSFWTLTIENTIKWEVIVVMVLLILIALVITILCEYSGGSRCFRRCRHGDKRKKER